MKFQVSRATIKAKKTLDFLQFSLSIRTTRKNSRKKFSKLRSVCPEERFEQVFERFLKRITLEKFFGSLVEEI